MSELLAVLALPLVIVALMALPRPAMLALIACIGLLFSRWTFLGIPLVAVAGGAAALLRADIRDVTGVRGFRGFAVLGAACGMLALLSVAWSPQPPLALQAAAQWLALIPMTIVGMNMVRDDGISAIGKSLALLSPILAIQAISTIVFRFAPLLESTYYASALSNLFLRDAGRGNNVIALDRAGGFLFTNVNRATLVMGIAVMLLLAYSTLARRRWPLPLAALLIAAIAVAGSKTAWIILLLLPLVALLISYAAGTRSAGTRIGASLVSVGLVSVAVQSFVAAADEFVEASQATLVPRVTLWHEGLRAYAENPLQGLGFGGWSQRWSSGSVVIDFSERPLHNWVLQAAVDGGAIYAALNIGFVALIVLVLLRRVFDVASARERIGVVLAAGAFLWAFVHGLGDNTSALGGYENLGLLPLAATLLFVSRGTAEPNLDIGRRTEKSATTPPGRTRAV